eukprot:6487832-Amphidinium_carterae.1
MSDQDAGLVLGVDLSDGRSSVTSRKRMLDCARLTCIAYNHEVPPKTLATHEGQASALAVFD